MPADGGGDSRVSIADLPRNALGHISANTCRRWDQPQAPKAVGVTPHLPGGLSPSLLPTTPLPCTSPPQARCAQPRPVDTSPVDCCPVSVSPPAAASVSPPDFADWNPRSTLISPRNARSTLLSPRKSKSTLVSPPGAAQRRPSFADASLVDPPPVRVRAAAERSFSGLSAATASSLLLPQYQSASLQAAHRTIRALQSALRTARESERQQRNLVRWYQRTEGTQSSHERRPSPARETGRPDHQEQQDRLRAELDRARDRYRAEVEAMKERHGEAESALRADLAGARDATVSAEAAKARVQAELQAVRVSAEAELGAVKAELAAARCEASQLQLFGRESAARGRAADDEGRRRWQLASEAEAACRSEMQSAAKATVADHERLVAELRRSVAASEDAEGSARRIAEDAGRQLAAVAGETQRTEAAAAELRRMLETERGAAAAARQDVDALTSKLTQMSSRLNDRARAFEALNQTLSSEKDASAAASTRAQDAEAKVVSLSGQIGELRQRLEQCVRESAASVNRVRGAEARADAAERRAGVAEERLRRLESAFAESDEAAGTARRLAASLDDLTARYLSERSARRALYNQLVEVRGNIRVACRIRPSAAHGCLAPDPLGDSITMNLSTGKQRRFQYDHVFRQDVTQRAVFEESCSDLVQSVVDGYNVCVLAYGQTGSGKTFTMFGGGRAGRRDRRIDPDEAGVIPRTLDRLWTLLHTSDCQRYSCFLSIVEIYCGEIRDLLADVDCEHTTDKQQIGTSVVSTRIVPVQNASDCERLMSAGYARRAEGSTACNDTSSRSHCVVTIQCSTKTCVNGKESSTNSRMVLVDLGGSECALKADTEGEQQRESSHINRSLSALSDVLKALSQGSRHIPFRNSKLTTLLSPCIGGNAKMQLFVTVSPDAMNSTETQHSLAFGSAARQVRRGRAHRQITSVGDP
eukprot:TRINITY_DN4020_c2_g1_i2.p1 TRINITY_DN4020_c2_g1~~TRINITY_DN4020_c2_g1_i2.p1  ORF type:complete len:951 (+),score=301.10 TRINITY_DN4020_c2_g1_i2:53-2854(+)